MADYYSLLGIPRDATNEQIRASYRQLALRFHPDKAGHEGAERFKEVQAAYEVLSHPQKRRIYDQFGAAAVDNPFSETMIFRGVSWMLIVLATLLFIVASMVVIFTAFIVAYNGGRFRGRDINTVDDHSRSYWNYVKVFSPLFVFDVIAGIPMLIVFVVSITTRRIDMLMTMVIGFCFIVLSILIPVTKDYNDMTMLRGGNDFRLWRVWLIPLYIATGFSTLLCGLTGLPAKGMRESFKANGYEALWTYTIVSFVLRIFREFCMVVFSVLIACRADEVITTNYFVVLAMPFYVSAALVIIDMLCYRICRKRMSPGSESYDHILLTLVPTALLIGLALASVSMVSKRLNDLYRVSQGGGGDVLSLTVALVPVYILLGAMFIFVLIVMITLCAVADCGIELQCPTENNENNRNEQQGGGGGNTQLVDGTNNNKKNNPGENPDQINTLSQHENSNGGGGGTRGRDNSNEGTSSVPLAERLSDID